MTTSNSASGEASISSTGEDLPLPLPPPKRKRNLPGTPDPEAEVIALSPKTLMATNRFVCEICNKGFQRDQNLQLHRRGHNLPWKLRQRSGKEARKRVYVCPEPSCVHHDPARALGDLTGIKKHFSRKHGEKKYKCDKCSKKYAVQSDWKAHLKICGTREYRCDCGTLFSRRDSFITHRAFCDALAEESAKAQIAGRRGAAVPPSPAAEVAEAGTAEEAAPLQVLPPREAAAVGGSLFASLFASAAAEERRAVGPPAAHLSATALLQKAAEMGASSSSGSFLQGFHPEPDDYPWPNRGPIPPPEAAPPALGLGPPGFFVGRPATLDLLGLGAGAAPAGGLSAFISSMGGSLESTRGEPPKAWDGASLFSSSSRS
ncbi:indeterminate(ID)-domain 2 [Wolffia australiana]